MEVWKDGTMEFWNAGICDALGIDLPKADEYRRYLQNPELLRAETSARKSVGQVVIDEVPKVPQLLDDYIRASARLCKIIRESPDLPVEVSAAFLAPHTATGGRVDLPNAEGIDNSTTVALLTLIRHYLTHIDESPRVEERREGGEHNRHCQ